MDEVVEAIEGYNGEVLEATRRLLSIQLSPDFPASLEAEMLMCHVLLGRLGLAMCDDIEQIRNNFLIQKEGEE